MQVTLERAGAAEYAKIKPLYYSAFPPEERPPFFLVKRKDKSGAGEMLAVKDGEIFVGFAYLICQKDLAYLFFLAIDGSRRGRGYGSAVLAALRERYQGKRLFLAREQLDKSAENYDQRVKRHSFYLKGGFTDLPCKIKEGPVVYDVMGVGGNITAEEYDALIVGWCGKIYKRLVGMELFA